ncbi:MAG: 4'-phosphopantetheinyl transferase family protein [Candidatus Microbacterium stercoravium]
MASAFDGLLPPSVACEDLSGLSAAREDELCDVLPPSERAVVAGAVAQRRREFAAVRHAARRALSRLGRPAGVILPGTDRAPRWPAGVVGSMTHCPGFRAAAVALDRDAASLGIDAEPHAPLPDGVHDLILAGEERAMLAELAGERRGCAMDRVLFSTKESIYKAWYPLTGRWLGFDDCEVTFDGNAFVGGVLIEPAVVGGTVVARFHGRWAIRDGIVLTAVHVPRPG